MRAKKALGICTACNDKAVFTWYEDDGRGEGFWISDCCDHAPAGEVTMSTRRRMYE